MRARGRSRKCLAAAVTVSVAIFAMPGAGSASAAGSPTGRAASAGTPAVHGGHPSGLYTPSGSSALTGPLSALATGPARALFGTSGASAGNGPSTQCPECHPPLFYGGGAVMHAVTTHVIEWLPTTHTFPTGYVTGFEQFLGDLSADLGQSDNISAVLRQYSDVTGPALSSLTPVAPIVDNTAYPAADCPVTPGASTCLMESDLTTELGKDISAHRLPVNLNQSYIVLLPKGVDTCFTTSAGGTACEDSEFCGYHTNISVGGSETTFALLPYTDSSFGSGPCLDGSVTYPAGSSPDLMALDSVGAHELFESATDPVPYTGYADSGGNEVADQCVRTYGAQIPDPSGGSYNQVLNGHQYLIQEMWSNQDNKCVQGNPNTASASISPGTVAVNSSSSYLTAALHGDPYSATDYVWNYEDSSGALFGAYDAHTSPTAQIPFYSTGSAVAWVEIADSNGGLITNVSAVTVDNGPTALFSSAPSNPAAGTSVAFKQDALPGSPWHITGYSWSFGDGTTSTTANPSHTYASAGTYTATLTVTQSDGLTATTPKPITIASTGKNGGSTGPANSRSGAQAASSSWLRRAITVAGSRLHIARLLKAGGVMTMVRSVTASGRLVIIWYATVKHHRVVVARGIKHVRARAAAHITVRLTAAGRALLRRSRAVEITAVGRYVFGHSHVTSTRTFMLRQ